MSQVADLAEAAAEMLQTDAVTGVEQAMTQALQFFLRWQLAFVDFQNQQRREFGQRFEHVEDVLQLHWILPVAQRQQRPPGTDKLDLSQLLQGENGTAVDDYLHFKVTGSGASLVTSIDVSAMAGAAPNQTIDLAGVNLASHYGVTPGAGGVIAGGHDTATIINGMLNDHSLKVDTV